MEIEDQVASVDPSKELRELGVKQDGYFSYFQYDKWNVLLRKTSEIFDPNPYWAFNKDNLICSAYTVAELGKMLPYKIEGEYFLRTGKTERYYQVSYFDLDSNQKHTEFEEKEADVRAKMLIYLIKEGVITAKNIK